MQASLGRSERRHEGIVRDFVAQIASGQIPVGERLPYESEIMERYGVSRTVARDAVQRIAAFGLVEVHRRAGAIVLPSGRWNMLEPAVLEAFMRGKPNAAFFSGLFEARLMLEPEAAALAAMRTDAATMDGMEAALEQMRNAATRDEFVDADMRFHTLMLDATGNWVLHQFASTLRAALNVGMHISRKSSAQAVTERSIRMHAELLKAIHERDALRSRDIMIWLLSETRSDVEAALAAAARPSAEALPEAAPLGRQRGTPKRHAADAVCGEVRRRGQGAASD